MKIPIMIPSYSNTRLAIYDSVQDRRKPFAEYVHHQIKIVKACTHYVNNKKGDSQRVKIEKVSNTAVEYATYLTNYTEIIIARDKRI